MKIKCLLTLITTLFLITFSYCQIGIGTTAPDATLDITSTNDGLLIPRVALSATNIALPLTAPAISELIYNTASAGVSPNNVIPGFYYWNGTIWVKLSNNSSSADNLGDHIATQSLNMNSNAITNATNITATGTATLGGNAYPTATGTNGQVLTTDGAGTISWSSVSSPVVVLDRNKITTQTIPIGNSISQLSALVDFDNSIVAPPASIGSWYSNGGAYISRFSGLASGTLITGGGEFRVNAPGLYFIQASILSTQTNTNIAALSPSINISSGAVHKEVYLGAGDSQGLTFNTLSRGRCSVSGYFNLVNGDIVTIGVTNQSSSNQAIISSDGSTRLKIIKF